MIQDIVVSTVADPTLTPTAALAIVAAFRSREGTDDSYKQVERELRVKTI